MPIETPRKQSWDDMFFILPSILTLINLVYGFWHHASPLVMVIMAAYFMAPAFVLAWARGKDNIPDKWDALVIVSMALIAILLSKRFGGTVNLPLVPLSAALEGWFLFGYCRGMTGLSFRLPKLSHLALALAVTALLCAVLMPIALKIGFPKPLPALQSAHGVSEIASLVWSSLLAPGFALMWIKKVLQTAVVEEILYRGLVLNMLQKRLGSGWAGILASNLLSSFLFGISHVGHGGLRYVLLSFIAGIGFGAIYQVAKNLTPSSIAHGVFDTITRALFEMKAV